MKRIVAILLILPTLAFAQQTKTLKPKADAFIAAGWQYENTNFGNWGYLWESSWAFHPGTRWENPLNRRILLKYDFSSIPFGSKIKSAKVSLVKFDGSTLHGKDAVRDLDLYATTTNWKEGQVTWKSAKNGKKWTTPGGDYNSTLLATNSTKITPFVKAEEWDITDYVQGLVNSTKDKKVGFLIKDRVENSLHEYRFYFYSKECSGSNKPKIVIEYEAPINGLYVDEFENILGNPTNEQALIDFAQCEGVNYLALYGLGKLNLNNPSRQSELKDFIKRAKNNGISQVAAMGETANSFVKNGIQNYNQNVASSQKEAFDAYHFEFQFWNQNKIDQYYCADYLTDYGVNCDETGALTYAEDQINQIKTLIGQQSFNVKFDIFLGWVDQAQANSINSLVDGGVLDRLFIAVYRKPRSDGSINLYNYNKQIERLSFLAGGSKKAEVVPVFASYESSGYHLHSWLQNGGSFKEAGENYLSGFKQETNTSIKNNILYRGFHWYRYSDMPVLACGELNKGPVIFKRQSQNIDVFTKSNEITVQFKTESQSKLVRVYNTSGKLVHQLSLNFDYNNIDFNTLGLSNGIYILQVSSDLETTSTKFIVSK